LPWQEARKRAPSAGKAPKRCIFRALMTKVKRDEPSPHREPARIANIPHSLSAQAALCCSRGQKARVGIVVGVCVFNFSTPKISRSAPWDSKMEFRRGASLRRSLDLTESSPFFIESVRTRLFCARIFRFRQRVLGHRNAQDKPRLGTPETRWLSLAAQDFENFLPPIS